MANGQVSSLNVGNQVGIANVFLEFKVENVLPKYSVQRVTEKDGSSDCLLWKKTFDIVPEML